MTEAKHTPGPWDQVPEGDNWIWLFHEPSQTRVARVVLYSGKEDENRDNARLIAAAPDMLETCRAALADCERDDWADSPLANQLRAVIAKATGG